MFDTWFNGFILSKIVSSATLKSFETVGSHLHVYLKFVLFQAVLMILT